MRSGDAETAEGFESVQSLAGPWRIRMDTQGAGLREKWFSRPFPAQTVLLPGTVDAHRIGPAATAGTLKGFSALHEYVGAVWYDRDVTICEAWRGRPLILFLERCQWETRVWVDGVPCGMRNSLAGPHEYDLSEALSPGVHRVTLMVDNANRREEPISPAATAASRRTDLQTDVKATAKLNCGGHHIWSHNWNGILGCMELRARPPVHIVAADVYPDIGRGGFRLRCAIGNAAAAPGGVAMSVHLASAGAGDNVPLRQAEWRLDLTGETGQIAEWFLTPEHPLRLWDEFEPCLYELCVELRRDGALPNDASSDRCRVVFGMRELSRRGTQFAINGRTTFLRGTLEDFIFPLTGHPPMDVASWRKVIGTAKLYGLNLFRFHSCCPPEAAFQAADEMGFYVQVELPGTSCPEADEDKNVEDFLTAELKQILRWYGNHPSLLLISMGNEQLIAMDKPDFLRRHQAVLAQKVTLGQRTDPRHMYTSTSHPYSAGRVDDYFVSAWPVQGPAGEPLCGIEWGGGRVIDCSRFNTRAPDTTFDYRKCIEGIDRPLVTHEVGQWAVFPDLREISRYHGAQRAFNFEIIRQRLADRGLLEWANDFTRASGMLALLLYREEIESALRTPGLGGFMLLDLHDFPGQGTSTAGILNALWESKGLIAPAAFRRFNAPCVLLARMAKRTWTTAETFTAGVELANYGPADIHGQAVWTIADAMGHLVAQGRLPDRAAAQGTLTALGTVAVSLAEVAAPTRLVLRLELAGVTANDWDAWVYPDVPVAAPDDGIILADGWSDVVGTALGRGGKVLLVLTAANARNAVPGTFTPVFWNVQMKHGQVSKTMGLLCDPAHPALAGFPTEFHSNWQWWDPVMRGGAIRIDGLPPAIRPIVRVIDSFTENRNLAMIFEAKVGPGRLLVCATDIVNDLDSRPVARQLRRSLLAYMAGPLFHPDVGVPEDDVPCVCL